MGSLYNHNVFKHGGGTKSQNGLYSAWGTTLRPIQLLNLLVVITEVNTYMTLKYLLKKN